MEVNEVALMWKAMAQLALGLSCIWLAIALLAYEHGFRKGWIEGQRDLLDRLYLDELEREEMS
jgi:hypothetical protein